jgi:hypothetical protein
MDDKELPKDGEEEAPPTEVDPRGERVTASEDLDWDMPASEEAPTTPRFLSPAADTPRPFGARPPSPSAPGEQSELEPFSAVESRSRLVLAPPAPQESDVELAQGAYDAPASSTPELEASELTGDDWAETAELLREHGEIDDIEPPQESAPRHTPPPESGRQVTAPPMEIGAPRTFGELLDETLRL